MKKFGKVKTILFRTLDLLLPATMNVIWSIYFVVICHKYGYAIFGTGAKQEAMDYLVK